MSSKYSLVHLSDGSLHRGLHASVVRDRASTAEMLAYLAEFDARTLYVPEGYDSIHAYCLGALRLSDDAASKRRQAARAARQFPSIFAAVEEGRLHLSAVVLLAPHLKRLAEAGSLDRCGQLLAAATHKSSAEVRQLIAEWFPREDQPVEVLVLSDGHAPEHVANTDSQQVASSCEPPSSERAEQRPAQEQVTAPDTWVRVRPIARERFELLARIDQATLDLLEHNRSLLSHRIPSGNLAEVLREALAEAARQFEKRKFRASETDRRTGYRSSPDSRHIPQHIKDAVWQRDKGRCTFVSRDGHRCGSTTRLEFDHIVPVARCGESTADNLRLLCRPHNQYEAKRALGADFMRHKREQAREKAKARTARVEPQRVEHVAASGTTHEPVPSTTSTAVEDPTAQPDREGKPALRDWIAEARARASAGGLSACREPDLFSVLRRLGMRAERARELAEVGDTIPEAPFAERLRVALSFHGRAIATPMRATGESASA